MPIILSEIILRTTFVSILPTMKALALAVALSHSSLRALHDALHVRMLAIFSFSVSDSIHYLR